MRIHSGVVIAFVLFVSSCGGNSDPSSALAPEAALASPSDDHVLVVNFTECGVSNSLHILDTGTGTTEALTQDEATRRIDAVALSPDKTQIAMVTSVRGSLSGDRFSLIETMDIDGSNRQTRADLVTADPRFVDLEWSRDGTELYFTRPSDVPVLNSIHAVDLEQGGFRELVPEDSDGALYALIGVNDSGLFYVAENRPLLKSYFVLDPAMGTSSGPYEDPLLLGGVELVGNGANAVGVLGRENLPNTEDTGIGLIEGIDRGEFILREVLVDLEGSKQNPGVSPDGNVVGFLMGSSIGPEELFTFDLDDAQVSLSQVPTLPGEIARFYWMSDSERLLVTSPGDELCESNLSIVSPGQEPLVVGTVGRVAAVLG